MFKRIALAAVLAVFACTSVYADFSYEQTTKITGGLMKSMSFLSKQLREPVRTTVSVKGDRMAMTVEGTSANVIDLSKETITEINFQKKTYSVITFAQMAEALKAMDARLKSEKGDKQVDIQMKPSVKETGQTRNINGMSAREVLVTIDFEGTNPDTKERGVFMSFVADTWVAPAVPGYNEVRSFHERMAQKLAWMPGMTAFAGGAETSRGMAEAYKEFAKMDGVPVLQVSKMGMGGAMPQGEAGQQQAQPQQKQAEAPKPSIGGALGRLGGGRLGGLGGLGRRRQEQSQEEAPAQQPEGQQAGGAPSLMELTTELSKFSTGALADSTFEVPAGFKQVDSETLKAVTRGR
jgi:carbon monoxide dehydrogenase subunit G